MDTYLGPLVRDTYDGLGRKGPVQYMAFVMSCGIQLFELNLYSKSIAFQEAENALLHSKITFCWCCEKN